jgi:adenylosuccinate lyase
LAKFIGIMDKLNVYPKRMRENMDLTRGLLFSQRVLLALVGSGLTREDAYALVQRNAMRAWEEKLDFRELVRQDPDVKARIPAAQLEKCFDVSVHLKNVDYILKRAGVL